MRILCLLVCWLLLAPSVQAATFEPMTIGTIEVKGLNRIELGTVLNYLPVHEGDRLDGAVSGQIIHALYKTGFFDDVRLALQGQALVITVTERPSIASIKISGNKDIETKQLNKVLGDIGLAEGKIFDRSSLERMVRELEGQYFAQGKYGVKVSSSLKLRPDNRVEVTINIVEGEVAKIARINIVGNHAFDEATLLNLFQLSPPSTWTMFSSNDQYARQKLAADLETLRSFYLDNGYINFHITSSQVSINPDRRSVYVTINILEGDKFRVSKTELSGDLVVPRDELAKLITIHDGDVFSRKALTSCNNGLLERLGDEGFAFANVHAVPTLDKENHLVALNFVVDPGKRVYVRRINITGNNKTSDEVVRREMRQMEGGWVSTAKIKRSRTRLKLLGFFDEVNIETPAVPGYDDQVDVDVSVSERPSGSLTAGVGYSQNQGLLVNANISQNNVFGSGNRVSAAINNSSVNTVYNFSFTDPYYTIDGVSRGFNVFQRTTDASRANIGSYSNDVYGGGVIFGIPLSELTRATLAFNYENDALSVSSLAPQRVLDFVAANSDTYDIINTTIGWSYDSRNQAVFPDEGGIHSLSMELALPGGDLQYYKLGYSAAQYWPLLSSLTGKLRWETGVGGAYSSTSELPFFERYFTGGSQSVRAFKSNSLGTKDVFGDPEGGDVEINLGAEVLFPMPLAEDSDSVRMSLFLDAGNVFSKISDVSHMGLRASAGVSVVWLTPMAPLTFSYGWPINKRQDDEVQRFQFTLGVSGL